ncbi:hypothetical protein C4885_06785 [Subdoligranulum sp. APC924/74]|nr:hypothetical protein C4885_06785 [Subdoligranulum sp. APC924/74]
MVHQKKPQRMLRLFCCTIPFGTDSHFAQALVFVSRGLVAKNGCGFVKQGPRLSVSESGERKRGANNVRRARRTTARAVLQSKMEALQADKRTGLNS